MENYTERTSFNHGITINERKIINITGVNKIESFDDEEFLLDTNMGYLAIKGSELEILKLDTKDGIIFIKGNFDNLSYFESLKGKRKFSFLDKLFK